MAKKKSNGCSDTSIATAIENGNGGDPPAELLPPIQPQLVRFSWLNWQSIGIIIPLLMIGAGLVASHTSHGNSIDTLGTGQAEIKVDVKETHKAVNEMKVDQAVDRTKQEAQDADIKEIKDILLARPD